MRIGDLDALFLQLWRKADPFKEQPLAKPSAVWSEAATLAREAPTIDPETLPVVRQLREELARVTEERDALLPRKGHLSAEMGDGCMIIYRHNRESLEESQNVVMVKYTPQYVEVGYSETGKEGPYTMAINADEYGAITMAQEVAEAIFGFIRDKEAHP